MIFKRLKKEPDPFLENEIAYKMEKEKVGKTLLEKELATKAM